MNDTDCRVSEFSHSAEDYTKTFYTTTDSNTNTTTNTNTNTNTDSVYGHPRSELEKLINLVRKGIRDDEPGIKSIKHPQLLLEALEELNSLVGMSRLKRNIALQTVELIERMKSGEKKTNPLSRQVKIKRVIQH